MRDFFKDETGASSIEIGIITITLVALALVFKEKIISLTTTISDKILG